MNFLEDSSNRLKSVSVIKFTNGLRFKVDQTYLKEELARRWDDPNSCCAFLGKGLIIDPQTGTTEEESFLFYFKGFFRDVMEGRIWTPKGVMAKDYDKYEKGKVYLLSFYYDTLELQDVDA